MKKYEKVSYEVDPHNRLILKSGKPSSLNKYRIIIDGTFKIDKNNHLSYQLKKPTPLFRSKQLPQNIRFKGSWSITEKHNMVYTLNKWQNQIYGNKFILKSGFIDISGNKLLFSLTTKNKKNKYSKILALSGVWCADRYNRINFLVEKENNKHDPIKFVGSWKVNKNNEITYKYRKDNRIHALILKGHWDISEKNRIGYELDYSKNSILNFRISKSRITNGKNIRYQLGIGYSKRKNLKIITLFGKWKINKRLGVIFEMDYGKHKVHSIVFDASLKLNRNYDLDINLRNRNNKPLGIKLTLSRSIFGNKNRAFIEFLRENREINTAIGIGFLF